MASTRSKKNKTKKAELVADVANNAPDFLDALFDCNRVLPTVLTYLEPKDVGALASINNTYSQTFFKPLRQEYLLFTYLINGDEIKVKEILKKSPEFIIKPCEAIELHPRTGRVMRGLTPLEIAYAEGDIQMCETILNLAYNSKIFEGELLLTFRQQIYLMLKKTQESVPYDFTAIDQAITSATDVAISIQLKLNPKARLLGHFEAFHSSFTQHINSLTSHFNLLDLRRAYVLLQQHNDDWSQEKKDLFWRQVIGYIQSLLPAYDLQALMTTLPNVLLRKEIDRGALLRVLMFQKDGHIFKLGFDYALGELVNVYDLIPITVFKRSVTPTDESQYYGGKSIVHFVDRYIQFKQRKMAHLTEKLNKISNNHELKSSSSCVIS